MYNDDKKFNLKGMWGKRMDATFSLRNPLTVNLTNIWEPADQKKMKKSGMNWRKLYKLYGTAGYHLLE